MKIITYEEGLGICEYIPPTDKKSAELAPGFELVRGEERGLHFSLVAWQLKHLMGEVLTSVEASIENERQLNATKSIIKNYFGRKIDWIYELSGMPEKGQEVLPNPED